MAIIKMSAFEKNDLLRILDYAEKKKKEDYCSNKINEKLYIMDKETIITLKKRANGIYNQKYHLNKNWEE